MSWSYSGDPSNSDLDLIRFMIGDTDSVDPELQDEEIQYEIDYNTSVGVYNPLKTSIVITRRVLAKYRRLCDESVGDVDVKWSQRFTNTKATLKELESQYNSEYLGSAFAGGISVGGKATQEQNTDRVQPAFYKEFGTNKRLDPKELDAFRLL